MGSQYKVSSQSELFSHSQINYEKISPLAQMSDQS